MYKEYFGLKEFPFSISPDPRYLYMSEGHKEALAHLIYGVNNYGGFVLLTGEVGTGKTTVCRCLLEQMPEDVDVAFILNPKLTVEELLASICDELNIRYPEANKSNKVFIDMINGYLLDAHAKGRRTVLIIEEAQNLGFEVLEQLRLLTNLETNQLKLLQIIIIGQPELLKRLSQPELRQLSQRITARYHLGPLPKRETASYVAHRLEVSGGDSRLIPASVIGKLHRSSSGVPRLINIICDRALLGTYVQGYERVSASILNRAAREVSGEPDVSRRRRIAAAFAAVLFAAVFAAAYFSNSRFLPAGWTETAREAGVSESAAEIPHLDTQWWFSDNSFLWRSPYASNDSVRYFRQAGENGGGAPGGFVLPKTGHLRKIVLSGGNPDKKAGEFYLLDAPAAGNSKEIENNDSAPARDTLINTVNGGGSR